MSPSNHILREMSGGVTTVTINRPDKRNALTASMRAELLSVLQDADADSTARVIVITGAGKAFCAGGDIAHLRALKSRNDEAGFIRLLDEGRAIVQLLRHSAKPAIAMVNGPAFGAGFFVSIACDLRICAQSATFGTPFVKLGLGPDWGGTYLLPRMIGTAKTLEMLYTGDGISSEEALRIGLVNRVYPDDELRDRVRALASAIAQRPAEVLARHKQAICHTMDGSFDTTADIERRFQLENFRSADFAEGVDAFLEKRPPMFGSGS